MFLIFVVLTTLPEMSSQFIGQSARITCADLGVFQGVICAVDTDASTVTLSSAFKNGKPCTPDQKIVIP